jgi:hypothetical protein
LVGYGALLSHARVWWWMVATVATRLAVCTVPLGAVFVAKEHTGSYAWGAIIAGAYAAGEAIGAPRMGARFQRRPVRQELCLVATAEAVALTGVVWSLSLGSPAVATLLAAVAGGVASGTFGGLRALVVDAVPGNRGSALALDVIVNQVCQVAGPAIAAVSVVLLSADAPLLIVSVGLLVTVAVAGRLPAGPPGSPTGGRVPGSGSAWQVLRLIWPSAVIVTVVLMIEAVLQVALPGIMEERRGSPELAVVALSGLAVASMAGSLLYGLRRWLGPPHPHTLVFASLYAVIVVVAGVMRSPVATVALVASAGFFQAIASTARSLTVTDTLPPSAWSVCFSVLYSCAAVGFTLSSAVSALFLAAGSATALLIALGLAGFTIFVIIGWKEAVPGPRFFGSASDRKAATS